MFSEDKPVWSYAARDPSTAQIRQYKVLSIIPKLYDGAQKVYLLMDPQEAKEVYRGDNEVFLTKEAAISSLLKTQTKMLQELQDDLHQLEISMSIHQEKRDAVASRVVELEKSLSDLQDG